MAGLLDFYDDPNQAGLLGLATGLLSASGPSRTPVSLGQALAVGMQGMQANRKAALDQQREAMQMDMLKQQIAMATTKADREQKLQNFIASRLGGAGSMSPQQMAASSQALGQGAQVGDVGPTVSNAARMDAIMPPSQQQPAGAFPFSLNDVTMLHALGGPNLTDAYKLATDPIKMEGGSVYRDRATNQERYIPKLDNGFMLNGDGSAGVVPGYIAGNSAIKGAETTATEGAKSRYALLPRDFTGVDGRPIGGSQYDYLFPQGGQPTQPRPAASPAGFPSVSPQQQAAADQEALRYAQQDIDNAPTPEAKAQAQKVYATMAARVQSGQSGITGGAFAPSAQPSGRPALQSEAEKQNQLGAITGRQQTQQKLNDNWITASYNPVVEAGRSAGNIISSLDALKNIDVKTGWGADSRAHAANVLTSLGIAPENAKMFAANAQKFQSLAMDRLMTVLQAQKGPQTEGDAQRAQQTWVQLQNTPEANQFIADFARAKANMDTRKAQFYQEAMPLAQQAGDLNEIDRRWNKIQGSIWADPVLQRYMKGK